MAEEAEEVAALIKDARSSVEVTRNAKGQFNAGPAHPGYRHGRQAAQAAYRAGHPTCERCGVPSILVHHKDRDRSHNESVNFEVLCKSCHEREHEADPHRPYPGPSAETIAKWRGRTPWNKGLTKAVAPNLNGGRRVGA